MELLSFVSNICDPGRSLSLEWQMLHMFPFSLDCKTVSGLNSWTRPIVHYYDDLWAGCGCCGSGSKWLEGGCGFPITATRDGSDRV